MHKWRVPGLMAMAAGTCVSGNEQRRGHIPRVPGVNLHCAHESHNRYTRLLQWRVPGRVIGPGAWRLDPESEGSAR